MANIRINGLPNEPAPSGSDFVPIDGLTTRKTTLTALVNAGGPLANQAEAEAGVNNSKRMTPLTTAQAISALGGAQFASTAQGSLADSALQPSDIGASVGNMIKATYDPTNINSSPFARGNHTGTQAIATVTNLQTTLDAKTAKSANLSDLANLDTSRYNITALKGYDINAFAGANESAKLAALLGSAPTQPFAYRSDSHIGIIRETSPLNYAGTEALLVTQKRHTTALAAQTFAPSIVFQQIIDANGAVTAASEISESIWQGPLSVTHKKGDGSGHTWTAIGELYEVGPGGYNECGIYQGEVTNVASTKGTIAGLEVLLRDGTSGVSNFDTRMYGAAARLNRRNAGARRSDCYVATSEGTQPVNSAFTVNQAVGGSPGGFQRYIDFSLAPAPTTGQAVLLPNNTSLAWLDAGGVSRSILFVSNANETLISAGSTTANITFLNSALAKQFAVASVASSVNYLEAVGAATTNAPLLMARGTDTNIGAVFGTQGTGGVIFTSHANSFTRQFAIAATASAVNYVEARGAITATNPSLTATGTDTNVSMTLAGKGTGSIQFISNGALVAVAAGVSSAVNYFSFVNSATGANPAIAPAGTDTNRSMTIRGKNTGGVRLEDGAFAAKFEINSTGVAWFATAPVAKQSLSAAATDAATTQTLANSIRTALINYGLAA